MRQSDPEDQRPERLRLGGIQGKLRARPQREFYFSLALRLGMTVDDMLHRISSRELTEWMAYFDIIAERAAKDRKDKTDAPTDNMDSMKDKFRMYAKPKRNR